MTEANPSYSMYMQLSYYGRSRNIIFSLISTVYCQKVPRCYHDIKSIRVTDPLSLISCNSVCVCVCVCVWSLHSTWLYLNHLNQPIETVVNKGLPVRITQEYFNRSLSLWVSLSGERHDWVWNKVQRTVCENLPQVTLCVASWGNHIVMKYKVTELITPWCYYRA